MWIETNDGRFVNVNHVTAFQEIEVGLRLFLPNGDEVVAEGVTKEVLLRATGQILDLPKPRPKTQQTPEDILEDKPKRYM